LGLARKNIAGYIGDVKTKSAKHKISAAKAPAAKKKPASTEEREEKKQAQALETVMHEVTAEPATEHVEEDIQVECPYCGESFELHVTSDDDGQTMYEDCEVCCRPISIHIHSEDGELQVEAHRS
jgi:hypothetical protein